MAIYHFSVKVIGRATGRSAVAAAAYRAGARLEDARLGRTHDFTSKAGVVHSEVMLPAGAPKHLADREVLWNEVEAGEKRKDAQLAREVEFALPREMSQGEAIACARDFVAREFVSRGMCADLNVHWDIGADGEAKPHAHVMLTLREVDAQGFGSKRRDWNASALLETWRENWAEHCSARLAGSGHEARIDHRSNESRGIGLEPQNKIGAAAQREDRKGDVARRAEDHRAIAARNGMRIIDAPDLGLDAITHTQATFTARDMAKMAHRHSADAAQYEAVLAAMRRSTQLVALGRDARGEDRFTTREMIGVEERMAQQCERLAQGRHPVARLAVGDGLAQTERQGLTLSTEQRDALFHVTQPSSLSLVVGTAGAGKSTMLAVARHSWEAQGYRVTGATLSGIAAENLSQGSNIASRTLASLERRWERGEAQLTSRHIVVVDEAGMVGARQMARIVDRVTHAGAKLVLVGDAQQLQAIEAGAAFRTLAERHGAAEIGTVRRQRQEWQRKATQALAKGRIGEAVGLYGEYGMVHAHASREEARAALIARWSESVERNPAASHLILTHLRDEVRELNEAARRALRQERRLGPDVILATTGGHRSFAAGDRILFLRNEASLGVRNGTLGTVTQLTRGAMIARTDEGRHVAIDLKHYRDIDYGYATTIHKAQGSTFDHAHILATPGLDAHTAYVALSRHRHDVQLHHGRDDFESQVKLVRTLSRQRPNDSTLDYDRAAQSKIAAAFAQQRMNHNHGANVGQGRVASASVKGIAVSRGRHTDHGMGD